MKNLESLLTIADAAAICQTCQKTIRRRIQDGDLVATKIGRQWRILPEDLDRFIRDGRT